MYSRSYEYQQYYAKAYYQRNKEEIRAHARSRLRCDCSSEICRGDLSSHRRTMKHQNYLKSLEITPLNICSELSLASAHPCKIGL